MLFSLLSLAVKTGGKKFGGYVISFAGITATAEQIFGKTPIAPSEITKKIWAFIRANKLGGRV